MTEAVQTEAVHTERVDFRVRPDRYKHWRLSTDGPVATLTMDVDEQGGLVPGYELKLNSYDLGVDIELYDAVQRLRFEHPEVRTVVITSGKPKIFCAGANIRMLAASSHSWKVNFCKFTNETRNGIEDASAHSGQVWPEFAVASSMPLRVSLVNLQKLTFHECEAPASLLMFAPAQKILSRPLVRTTTRTSGCSNRSRCTAS